MFEAYGLALLLPVAAASGWFMATRMRRPEESSAPLNPDYIRGLNHLVNEEPDKAIEVFVRLLDVDNDTVETHLALGNLFRRRGEVDRALRIHQNLVARPNLKPLHRNQARFELAKDFFKAGVFDRAEELFEELAGQGMFLEASLRNLISIYEQESDWQNAVGAARRLEPALNQSLRTQIAQYHCELAEQYRLRKDFRGALRQIKRALAEDYKCVRASLIRGQVLAESNHPRQAIRALKRVAAQQPAFLSETFATLEQCFTMLDELDGWKATLEEFADQYASPRAHVILARRLSDDGNARAATELLNRFLESQPNWIGFACLLELAVPDDESTLGHALRNLRDSLTRMIEASSNYHCGQCGYAAGTLYWQCPTCRNWDCMSPNNDLVPDLMPRVLRSAGPELEQGAA